MTEQFDRDTTLNKAQQRETYFKKHYPDTYKKILGIPAGSWQEKLYIYINRVRPGQCPVCGKPTKFVGFKKGYNEFCCAACANKAHAETVARTKLIKYGSTGFNNRDKARSTCMERYGVPTAAQSESIRQKLSRPHTEETRKKMSEIYWSRTVHRKEDIQSKREQTTFALYGANNTMRNPELKEKLRQTFIERYGCPPGANKAIREASAAGILEKTKRTYPEFIGYEGNYWVCRCPHPECTKCEQRMYVTGPEVHRGRLKHGSELCTKLLPVGAKDKGTTIELFIRGILDELGIPHIDNSYNILSGRLSLDIYIPSKNIAIECNGCYWHSTIHKAPKDHYRKFKLCQAQGIQLLTIWEDWIVNKPEIVRSLLLNKLGCTPNKIYARKCEIKEVSSHVASTFYNANHIQGRCNSKLRLGLYHNGQLVSLMAFNKRSTLSGSKKLNDGEWELIRFANLLNTTVVGGASRLLKYFIKTYKPAKITSFSSNDISSGALYKTLGFVRGDESVGYWYIKNCAELTRYHRSTFTKDRLIQMGLAPNANKYTWTEAKVMNALPFYRIYDSGTARWSLDITNDII